MCTVATATPAVSFEVPGNVITKLATAPQEMTGTLKERALTGIGIGCDRLQECFKTDGQSKHMAVALTLVQTSPSSLAAHMATLECSGSEVGAVGDVADEVFQSEYAASVRYQPRVEDIMRAMPQETRTHVVAWLGKACEATLIDDALLHGAVLTLDRYAATCTGLIDEMELFKLSLASLCTEMKLTNEDDFPMRYWQNVLLHLSQERELLPVVLEIEARMLRRLQFVVGVPTALSFLNGLGMRFASMESAAVHYGFRMGRPPVATRNAALQLGFARLLAELALYDIELEYRYPPAILAAGTIGAALFAIGPTEVLRDMHDVLIDDLRSYCPNEIKAKEMVSECELELLQFWQECARGNSRASEYYGHLCQRHARNRRNANVPGGDGIAFGAALLALNPEVALDRYHILHSQSDMVCMEDL